MPGDITRTTFDPTKHRKAVRMQQGRVQLDSDWNEQIDISAHRVETEAIDVIGPRGAPRDNAGFAIQVKGNDLVISAGRIYVDGILCENDQEGLSLTKQDDLPGFTFPIPTSTGRYLVYLDVWERDITALDDPQIREVALGGPDTCTRTKTVWQVKLTGPLSENATCSDGLSGLPLSGHGLLKARAQPDEGGNDPCIVPFRAGYRRLENQLYRVEIHDDDSISETPTFKWSRDNATVVARWLSTNGNALTVSSVGRDAALGFAPGQWVELVDDTRELQNLPGTLVQLNKVEGGTLTIDPNTATATVDPKQFGTNPKVRRWDSPALVPITPNQWQDLEDGVQVQFQFTEVKGTYRAADYWLIPARTATGDVEWPSDAQNAAKQPQGIRHHYCALAMVSLDTADLWQVVEDCRLLFPPLTEEAIHITELRTLASDSVMLNDAEIPLNILAQGINIICDRLVDLSTISRATCFVTLELPISAASSVLTLGAPPVGFVPVVLASEPSDPNASSNKIPWKPAVGLGWLNDPLSFQDRILAHLTLKGSFIWQMNNHQIFLDGESFGQPRATFEDLRFPTGDSRRAGNFEMWFWIVKSLDVLSVTLDPVAVAVGDTATGTVALNGPAPQAGLTVNLSTKAQNIAVPANVFVPEGQNRSAQFTVTTSNVGDAVIEASLTGSPVTAPLQVIGIASLQLSPPNPFTTDRVDVAVTLTGNLPKNVSVGISITGSVELHSSFVILQNSAGHFFFTPQDFAGAGGGVGDANVKVSLGSSTQQATLTVQSVG